MKAIRSICYSMRFIHKITFLMLVALVGCSSNGIQVKEIPNTANVVQELQSFDNDMNNAAAVQVNLLSPHNFKEAKKYLEEAKNDLSEQKKTEETLHQIATGRAYLSRANDVAAIAQGETS